LISEPSILYFNKDYFYKNGYDFRVFDDNNKDINMIYNEIIDENYIHFKISKNTKNEKDNKQTVYVALSQKFNYTENYSNPNQKVEISYELAYNKANYLEIINREKINLEVNVENFLEYKLKIDFSKPILLSRDLIHSVTLRFKNNNKDNNENMYEIKIQNLLFYKVKIEFI
jgi:hypothetical protein